MQASTRPAGAARAARSRRPAARAITLPHRARRTPSWSCPARSGAAGWSSAALPASLGRLAAAADLVGQRRPCRTEPAQPATSPGDQPCCAASRPRRIRPPLANYSHAIEVPPNARWLYVSGQLGIAPDGTVPDACAEQAEACFANFWRSLPRPGWASRDLVRLNTYLTDAGDRAAYMAVRDRLVAAPPPASTLLVVRALARPEFKIEIEAIAARAARPGRSGPARGVRHD